MSLDILIKMRHGFYPLQSARLGQAPPAAPPAQVPVPKPKEELLEVDRMLADAGKVAILHLGSERIDSKEVGLTPCWRTLRVRKWPLVSALQAKLAGFLDTADQALHIPEAEFSLLEEVLTCDAAIERLKEEESGRTIVNVGGLVGIAGGMAALLALVL